MPNQNQNILTKHPFTYNFERCHPRFKQIAKKQPQNIQPIKEVSISSVAVISRKCYYSYYATGRTGDNTG